MKLGFVAVLHLPLPALGLGPFGEHSTGRGSGDAAAADVVEDDAVAELVGKCVDRVPGGLDVGTSVAEAFGGEIGERHQVGRVGDVGRGGWVGDGDSEHRLGLSRVIRLEGMGGRRRPGCLRGVKEGPQLAGLRSRR